MHFNSRGLPTPQKLGNHFDFMHKVLAETGNLLRLFRWIQPLLQSRIVCRDAHRTGILVAFHRLNATQVVFDALIRERHVTRVANVIGLSQPAFSIALTRL